MKKRIIAFGLTLLFVFGCLGFSASVSPIETNAMDDTMYKRRGGGTPIDWDNIRIDYAYTVVDEAYTDPALPYAYDSGISCGITAAGNTVIWYDRTLTNLIPNFTPATYFLGRWIWASSNSEVQTMYNGLEVLMGNNGINGVTIAQYKEGLQDYVNLKGYDINYSQVRSNNNALTNNFETAIANNKLVSLFLSSYNICTIYPGDGYEAVSLTQYAGAHIMTACGYRDIKYYDANNNLLRHDYYVSVQTGFQSLGWIRMNEFCTLDAAWVTDIH